ncbi:hypothetical protein NADFUDRAFT_80981 [Nadsonia fulvescens var. elongata DSM 6958]|uniref:Respiratory supercomplex factor 1, mitochondrial n=1 Tax=Nadsonia fulvescens var. elongata DSM 6958 TaxID=857566 RepID=A0A1E3PSM8_9ASCO|nr:hypothetical protein NADFUDRAFT_80981 [Nadsonia fulvescens var. elongata DSM 6958]
MSTLPSSFDTITNKQASIWDRVVKNCKQEPLVPLGCGLTTLALVLSGRAIKNGNRGGASNMFKLRVIFQGLTVGALVAGAFFMGKTGESKKAADELDLQQLREKDKLWIQELEKMEERSRMRRETAVLARAEIERARSATEQKNE